MWIYLDRIITGVRYNAISRYKHLNDHQDHKGDGHEHDGRLVDVGWVVRLRLILDISFMSLQDLHVDHTVTVHVIQQLLTVRLGDKDCHHFPCGIRSMMLPVIYSKYVHLNFEFYRIRENPTLFRKYMHTTCIYIVPVYYRIFHPFHAVLQEWRCTVQ